MIAKEFKTLLHISDGKNVASPSPCSDPESPRVVWLGIAIMKLVQLQMFSLPADHEHLHEERTVLDFGFWNGQSWLVEIRVSVPCW